MMRLNTRVAYAVFLVLIFFFAGCISVEEIDESTFYGKTRMFWKDFAEHRPNLEKLITEGSPQDAVGVFEELLTGYLPGILFQFIYDPVQDHIRFSFSPKGNRDYQYLVRYCLMLQPEQYERWSFYPSKQPNPLSDQVRFTIFNKEFYVGEFQVQPVEYDGKFDIRAYHPHFLELTSNQKHLLVFLLLDEVLGEYGTELYVGNISAVDQPFWGGYIGFPELKAYIDRFILVNQIDPGLTPDQMGVNYFDTTPDPNSLSRMDIIAGTTTHIALIQQMYGADPLRNRGAEYLYLTLDAGLFNLNRIVEQRVDIEEKLKEAFLQSHAGFVIGGATGVNHCYIDLLIFNGDRSVQVIEETMAEFFPDYPYDLHSFFDPLLTRNDK